MSLCCTSLLNLSSSFLLDFAVGSFEIEIVNEDASIDNLMPQYPTLSNGTLIVVFTKSIIAEYVCCLIGSGKIQYGFVCLAAS